MRNTWKYILTGVVVVIIILVLAAGVLLVLRSGFFGGRTLANGPFGPRLHSPFGFMPMMGGFGIGGLIFMLFGLLIPLGILGLLVAGVIALFTRSRVVPPAPPVPPSASPVAPLVTAEPNAPVKTCPNCGRPVQADWTHCPYCGAPLP